MLVLPVLYIRLCSVERTLKLELNDAGDVLDIRHTFLLFRHTYARVLLEMADCNVEAMLMKITVAEF